MLYQREDKSGGVRTQDIELNPVETYVVDTEKQQKLVDERTAEERAHYNQLDKLPKTKSTQAKGGILTNALTGKS